MKSGESKGKSGSFFFFSHDNKFIIKSMFEEEMDVLMDSLKDYKEHLAMYPESLIARIYGIFQVDMDGIEPVSLLLMANTI